MKKISRIFFGRAWNIGFPPVNIMALAIVLMSVLIAITPALPIAAILKGPAEDVSYFRFYIEKRQWLADSRTLLAGIHYLYESHGNEDDSAVRAARPEVALL
jgi:hypothetical protein